MLPLNQFSSRFLLKIWLPVYPSWPAPANDRRVEAGPLAGPGGVGQRRAKKHRVVLDVEQVVRGSTADRPERNTTMRRTFAAAGSVLLAALLAGCAGAGSGAPQQGDGSNAAPEAPTCGTSPVVLNAFFETGFDLPFKLSEEFTKQYPNVT